MLRSCRGLLLVFENFSVETEYYEKMTDKFFLSVFLIF